MGEQGVVQQIPIAGCLPVPKNLEFAFEDSHLPILPPYRGKRDERQREQEKGEMEKRGTGEKGARDSPPQID